MAAGALTRWNGGPRPSGEVPVPGDAVAFRLRLCLRGGAPLAHVVEPPCPNRRPATTLAGAEAPVAFTTSSPVEREAARRLGVPADADQATIDRRFRELVKAARPDLGGMDPAELAALVAARRELASRARAGAQGQPAGADGSPGDGPAGGYDQTPERRGRVIDLRG